MTGLAEACGNLANATGDPRWVESAINYTKSARRIFARSNAAYECAAMDWYLWDLYRTKTTGDIAHNRDLAIRYYQRALTHFSKDAFPEKWALIQEGLAISYQTRLNGKKLRNLRQAKNHLEMALQVFRQRRFRDDSQRVANRLSKLKSDLARRFPGARA
jgi:hypothetical protein